MLCQIDNITYSIGLILGTLIGIFIRIIVYSFIIAIFVRFTARLVAKFTPKFGKAYKASFIALLLSCLALVTVRILIMTGKVDPLQFPEFLRLPIARHLLNLAIVIAVSGFIYGIMLSSDGRRLGFGKGLAICVINVLFIASVVIGVSSLVGFPIETLIRILFLM